MNDREIIVQTISTILYCAKAMGNQGTPLEEGESGCLMETFKIALFPHVSDDTIGEISKQVLLLDKKLIDVMQKTADYDGPQPEILQ